MNFKKIVKSISAAAMALVIGVSLVSCGDNDGAKSYLEKELKKSQELIGGMAKDLKDGKTDKIKDIPGLASVIDMVKDDPNGLKTVGEFAGKMGEFEYSIDGVKESGDTATAKVKIKTYNFKEILDKAQVDLLSDAESIVSSAATPEESQRAIVIKMFKYVAENAKDKSYEQTVEVKLQKQGKQWTMDPNSVFEITKVTTGGLN